MSLQRHISFASKAAALSLASAAQAFIHSSYERVLPVRMKGAPLRILAVQCGQVGDFVLTLPFFDEIKKRCGDGIRLAVIVDSVNEGIARECPNIDEVLVYDSPKYTRSTGRKSPGPSEFLGSKAFDAAFWFRGDRKIFWWILRKKVPMVSVAKYPNPLRWSWIAPLTGKKPGKYFMHYSQCVMSMASELTEGAGADRPCKPEPSACEDKNVYVHVGAGNMLRKWPEENFASICALLLGLDRDLVIRMVGSNSDAQTAQRVSGNIRLKGFSERIFNECGTTTLPGLLEKFSKGRLFIGFDSGPMHMAASSGIPVVALMGPQSPGLFGPRGAQEIRVIYKNYQCSPCWQFRCLHTDYGPGLCVLDISPQDVFEAAREVLLKTGVIHGN